MPEQRSSFGVRTVRVFPKRPRGLPRPSGASFVPAHRHRRSVTPPRIIRHWVRTELWDQVPVRIAVIDRDFKIVEANRRFTENYGDWKARPCYCVYKDRTERCDRCAAAKTFADGLIRVREELGVVIEGTQTYYLVRTVPLLRHDGSIPYIIEMSTDITETTLLEREPGVRDYLRMVLGDAHFNVTYNRCSS